MKKSVYLGLSMVLIVMLFGVGLSGLAVADVSLSKSTLNLIDNAVFEVVVPKPKTDSLTYEKPLPLDLIPYAIRTDKYYSIGTAFAISPTQFVSASHVFSFGVKSQFDEYFLRDKEGNIYSIDKIVKYSDRRDFVVFTLKDKTAKQYFQMNTEPKLNDKVYAVGNALGEGVVIRDGLYTSGTPEELNGEWKWIRFSAAASPGNSGGPLLDSNGKVIGLILQKSQNENLNIALPIKEVQDAKNNEASIFKKMGYSLDIMRETKIDILQSQIPLPKSYAELNNEMVRQVDDFSQKLLKALLTENRDNIFPNGKGSVPLLNATYNAVFPNLIAKGSDGYWDTFYPNDIKDAEIGLNGFLSYGGMGSSLYLYIQKPDDVPLDRFYKDSKLFMDSLLKGYNLSREVGSEKIKITSLGKAKEDYIYTDSYGRKWQVRSWLLEYNDEKVVTFSLPVPGGYVIMLRGGQTGQVDNGHIPDLKVLADFIYVSYYGTFKQWREFLMEKELLPSIFSTLDISFDYDRGFQYKSKRLSFSYTPELLVVSENSDLKIEFGYFNEGGATVWDVNALVLGADKNNATSFSISRNLNPPLGLSDKYRSDWENIVNRRIPYNNTAFFKDKYTQIANVYVKNLGSKPLDSAKILYTVWYERDGNLSQKEMEPNLAKFMQNMSVKE